VFSSVFSVSIVVFEVDFRESHELASGEVFSWVRAWRQVGPALQTLCGERDETTKQRRSGAVLQTHARAFTF
jgi:hypothetical protein